MEFITVFLAVLAIGTVFECLLLIYVSNISDKLERLGVDISDIYEELRRL